MKNVSTKQRLKSEIRQVMRSMDFVSGHPALVKGGRGREAERYAAIYQQLALAWEHLALQCRHWDGFRARRGGTRCCPICGLVEGVKESWLLLPRNRRKIIGRMTRPTSTETFASRKAASVLDDTLEFHGAKLRLKVANPSRSDLFRDFPITVMAHRTATLAEDGVECSVDEHMVRLRTGPRKPKTEPPCGAFLWELPRQALKRFPVILEYDRRGRFVGLCIFRAREERGKRAVTNSRPRRNQAPEITSRPLSLKCGAAASRCRSWL
jgi:hypothetical protein